MPPNIHPAMLAAYEYGLHLPLHLAPSQRPIQRGMLCGICGEEPAVVNCVLCSLPVCAVCNFRHECELDDFAAQQTMELPAYRPAGGDAA